MLDWLVAATCLVVIAAFGPQAWENARGPIWRQAEGLVFAALATGVAVGLFALWMWLAPEARS